MVHQPVLPVKLHLETNPRLNGAEGFLQAIDGAANLLLEGGIDDVVPADRHHQIQGRPELLLLSHGVGGTAAQGERQRQQQGECQPARWVERKHGSRPGVCRAVIRPKSLQRRHWIFPEPQ